MKACVLREFGTLDRVNVEEFAKPCPTGEELLIRVSAASINPIDWKLVDGSLQQLFPVTLPRILGRDCAGIVVASSNEEFCKGDRVLAVTSATRNGTHAEYVLVSPTQAALIPPGISEIEAVAVGNSGATALLALTEVAKVRAGQRILIHGAAGAVGALAVQIARHLGVDVIATCSASNVAYVNSLGANRVIDYQNQDFESLVADCDAVLDLVGGDVHKRSFSVLRSGGVLAYVHALPISSKTRPDIRVERAEIRAQAVHLHQLLYLTSIGAIKPRIARIFDFQDAPLAYREAASKHPPGKLILKMNT